MGLKTPLTPLTDWESRKRTDFGLSSIRADVSNVSDWNQNLIHNVNDMDSQSVRE
jgi:hypothetical protein